MLHNIDLKLVTVEEKKIRYFRKLVIPHSALLSVKC